MQAKILEGVAVTTTLGDTLVELQILCFFSMKAQGLGLSRSIESLCGLLQLPHLPHRQIWLTFRQLSQTQQRVSSLITVFRNQEGQFCSRVKKNSKYKFFSLVLLHCQQAWIVPWKSHAGTYTLLQCQQAWSVPWWSFMLHLSTQEAFLFFHI